MVETILNPYNHILSGTIVSIPLGSVSASGHGTLLILSRHVVSSAVVAPPRLRLGFGALCKLNKTVLLFATGCSRINSPKMVYKNFSRCKDENKNGYCKSMAMGAGVFFFSASGRLFMYQHFCSEGLSENGRTVGSVDKLIQIESGYYGSENFIAIISMSTV